MTYSSSAVEWDKLDTHTYERMISVLLSHLYARARRTDGAGGDGGKDVHFPGADGLEVFELKSFTGRMNDARWRQVKRSLARAAEVKPSAWRLVLPIDFTPGEEGRFARLTAGYSFTSDYFGLTWLDQQMAQNPVIPRYFLQGGAERVVELLKELGQEQAVLSGGAQDLVQRLQRLSSRADEIDPYYRFSFGVFQGHVALSLSPRYPGAENDRPITVSASFSFPDTPEGRKVRDDFEAAIRFGSEAAVPAHFVSSFSVDAPAGLGGEHGGGEFLIKGTATDGPALKLHMTILDPDGRQLASLPLTLGPRSFGISGFEATATDPTGSLRCRLRVNGESMNLNLAYQIELPPRCLPSLALPTLRFLSRWGAPNQFQLRYEGGEAAMPAVAVGREPLVSDEYVSLVAAFERVQAHTQTYFDLPSTLSEEDYRELLEAELLIKGEAVRFGWKTMSMKMEVGAFVDFAMASGADIFAGQAVSLYLAQEYEARIAGSVLPLGPGTKTLSSAMVENTAEVRAAYQTDAKQEIEIWFRPGSTPDGTLQLGIPPGAAPAAEFTAAQQPSRSAPDADTGQAPVSASNRSDSSGR